MIEPRWLANSYIIQNTAIDYDPSSVDIFSPNRHTNIEAIGYRKFASTSDTRSSCFQPVLERLQYIPPNLVGSEPFLILEGITDYHIFIVMGGTESVFSCIPGSGAGASSALISLLVGRGARFVLLLDDDNAGRIAAEKYRNVFGISSNEILTIGELDKKFLGKQLEGLLDEETISKFNDFCGVKHKMKKKNIRTTILEAASSGVLRDLLSESLQSDIVEIRGNIGNRLS
jgi:hypothetical protein